MNNLPFDVLNHIQSFIPPNKEDIIAKTYEDANYPSLEKLFTLLKKKNVEITRKEVKAFLEQQLEQQLTKTQHIKKATGHITDTDMDGSWQMDVFNLVKYSSYNKGYEYIFAVVDVFSRKAYSLATKNKEAITITKALQTIIDENEGPPRVVTGDNDSDYKSTEFSKLLDKYEIVLDMNVLNDHNALGIIDNFAKRIKLFFTLKFLKTKSKNWVELLPGFIKNYNNSEHKSLDYLTPNEARLPENKMKIEQINLIKSQETRTTSDLVENNKVRLRISGIFKKGTEPKWSDEFYTVEKTIGNTVYLSDGKKYKRNNLLKIPDNTKENTTINVIAQNNKDEKGKQAAIKSSMSKSKPSIVIPAVVSEVRRSGRTIVAPKFGDQIYDKKK